jgi:putative ATP-binding cassette transporter
VSFQHPGNAGDKGFEVGPVDLTFRKGSITFIVGGNGSGKSSLCKLLSTYYPINDGHIYFGEHLLTKENMLSCRLSISTIFSDYYLFDRIYGHPLKLDHLDHYLKLFKLHEKVKYIDGKFSTLALSDGQRRRMALVIALIEDKDLYVFDEWAADQDPEFRATFYSEVLPTLKAAGKAVVAITHDDRYFSIADVVVTMADGRIQSVKEQFMRRITA